MSAVADSALAPEPSRLQNQDVVLGTIVLCLAPFLSVLDLTLVNIILPHIAGTYGATPTEATLVVTVFAVAQAISMPLSGWLAQRFGTVRIFLFSLAAFTLSSFLCGISPSLDGLVLCRILQGLSAGPIVPLSQAIMQRTFPPKYVAPALTMWGMALMTGPLVGPALGGMLADSIGWEWGFFVNIPIVAVCIIMTARMFMKHESQSLRLPIDTVGLVLLVVWVAAIQIVLDHGRQYEWFASPFIVTLTVVSVIAFLAFMIWELTEKHPIIDLSVFRYRSFNVIVLVMVLSYGAATAGSLMIYLWLQTSSLQYDATTAGYVAAITGIPGLITGPLVAMMTRRVDIRVLASMGLFLTAISLVLRTGFTLQIDFSHVIVAQIIIGIAGPFFWGPLIAIGMRDVPHDKISSAAGLLTFTRTLGFAMQVALMTTFLESGAKYNHAELAGELNQVEGAVRAMEAKGMGLQQALAVLQNLVEQQGMLLALHQMYWFLGAMVFICIVGVWVIPAAKPGPAQAPAPAAEP